jgi:putative intracellular protease/amidase
MTTRNDIRIRRTPLVRAARHAATGLVAFAAFAGVVVVGVQRSSAQLHQTPRPEGAHPTATAYGSGTLKVAVVLGASGTTGTDAMGPYEVFAISPHFTVYTVAATHGVAAVEGGPGIVPAYTFNEVESGQAPTPDVVVVPALEHPDAASEKPLRDFVRSNAERGARILSVCNGASVLAETGVLDGLPATAHWSRLGALQGQYPSVRWTAGRRYVDATTSRFNITSTAGITSGIPGALHVMADLAGADEALRVSKLVAAHGWAPESSTQIAAHKFGLDDLPALLNVVMPWGRPTAGIVLADGVNETDVAAAFEVYTVSQSARAVAVADDGWVTTRHGMVLAATATADAPPVDRRIVLPTRGPSTHAFDTALQRVATTSGTTAAASAAKMVEYPDPATGKPWTWAASRAPALVVVILLAAVAAVTVAVKAPRRLSRRRRA